MGWDKAKMGWDVAKMGCDVAKLGWDGAKMGWDQQTYENLPQYAKQYLFQLRAELVEIRTNL